MFNKVILVLSLSVFSFSVFAQNLNLPLQFQYTKNIEAELNKQSNSYFHTTIKPLNQNFLNKIGSDSIIYKIGRADDFLANRKKTKLWKKLRSENLVHVKHKDYEIIINPLLNFSYTYDAKQSEIIREGVFSINTRGVEVKGNVGKRLAFYSNFFENQANFVSYLDEYFDKNLVVSGQGTRKNFGTNGHDFAIVSGYVSFLAHQNLNIQLGHGKSFIGNGYRSLLLSDNATVNPYLKFNFKYNKFQYVFLLTQNIAHYNNFVFDYRYRSGGSFTFLSYTPTPRIEISIFEGLTAKISDSTSIVNYPFQYFNPVMFTRAAGSGLNDENNIILGLNLKANITNYAQVYGQFMLDNFEQENPEQVGNARYGYQIGFKYFNALAHLPLLKQHQLYLQAEYNTVSPYSYSSYHPWQSYSHINQPLAHPLGANFNEIVGILQYSYEDFLLNFKYSSAKAGTDYNDFNFGSNIFELNDFTIPNESKDLFTGEQTQGLVTTITNKFVKLAFIINPRTNLQFYIGYHERSFENEQTVRNDRYLNFGLKTSIRNFYYDF